MKKICFAALLVMMLPLWLFAQTPTVTFSQSGGFYENSFNLELTCDGAYQIRYTTNGATPTVESPLYKQPLVLDQRLYSKSDIYTIVTCIPSRFYAAESADRCIIIRAAAFDDKGHCVSDVETNSYFIRSLGCDFHGMPVMSLAADSLALFDYETGIFVPGVHYDDADSRHTGNYYQRGRQWEREINLEFYELDNTGVNQRCGVRTHGNASRWFQQKGMKLYARKEYGKKNFKHKFFEALPYKKFKHLTLHPFQCSVWLHSGAQEFITQNIAANLNVDALAVRQITVFLNGEYWGIYTLEETPDERYLETRYHVDLDKVNIIKYFEVEEYGDISDWYTLLERIKHSDLRLPADSTVAFSRIDVPELIDYFLLELFTANLDWPDNNVRIWQDETGHPFRFIFFDADGCLTRWDYKVLNHATNSGMNSVVLNHFMQNRYFKRAFYNRYLELKSTYFSQDSMRQELERFRSIVKDEVPKHSKRFGFPKSVKVWERDLDSVSDFIAYRHDAFEEEFYEHYSIKESDIDYFTCFPNPNNKIINVIINSKADNMTKINIYNSWGRTIFSEKFFVDEGSNSIIINIDLTPGVYFIETQNLRQRIII